MLALVFAVLLAFLIRWRVSKEITTPQRPVVLNVGDGDILIMSFPGPLSVAARTRIESQMADYVWKEVRGHKVRRVVVLEQGLKVEAVIKREQPHQPTPEDMEFVASKTCDAAKADKHARDLFLRLGHRPPPTPKPPRKGGGYQPVGLRPSAPPSNE